MIGDRLGPYTIDRELGSGGMGRVYAATVDGPVPGISLGTHVAVKVVHPHLLETPDAAERFAREVRIGQTVEHPNVVRTYAGGEEGGHHYMVMEFVEGQTLDGLLGELERVPEELCRHIGREVCKGLSAIHAAGAIHRDMKPENVLITPEHVVKIMDLGVARSTDDALRLSQTGAFVGSLHYACPEQFKGGGKDLDGRVDLHALGLVLYELAGGVNPYLADDIPQTVRKVLHEEPRRLGELNPQLSPFFEEVVHCLLEKDRDARFGDAAQLLSVLESGEDSAWWHERARALQLATHRPIRRIRIPRETAVYGREPELAELRALFDAAKNGDGQVALIEGEAGIGKSRLIDELIGRLERDGEEVNFLFGSYPPNGAATASGAFSLAYREHFGEAGSADYLGQTPLLAPAFDALLRGDAAPPGVEPLTKDSLQTCFVNATRALAAQQVTVVLIDDLHFAPEEGHALFTSLAMAAPGHRVLLIGTTRPVANDEWLVGLDRFDHTTRIAPQRLAAKDVVELLEEAFRSHALAESLGLQIIVKSDGNPFFAFEIIRGLREGQFITQRDDGTWVTTQVIEDIQIPSSVLDLVNARVAGLSEDERALLDVAACWGFEFDPLLVGEVLGMKRIPLLRQLGQIERQHRLVRASGRTYVFDHHQVQEALYGSLSELLREEYHAALAETLEARSGAMEKDPETLDGSLCVDLCEHYLKASRGEQAVRYLDAAQTHLARGYLHAQVVDFGERALAFPDLLTGVERARALMRLCDALRPLGRRDSEEECALEADHLAAEAGDDELRVRAALSLGWCFHQVARNADAEAAYGRALDLARARGDRKTEATANGLLGIVFMFQFRFDEAHAHTERDLEISREIGDRRGEARATGNLGSVFKSQSLFAQAREHHERHLVLSREIGDRRGEATATGNLGSVLKCEGRLPEALENHARALEIFRAIGDRRGEGVATANRGGVFYAGGRLPEASEHFQRYIALAREMGDRLGEAIVTGNLGNVLQAQGRVREAREQYEGGLALSRATEDRRGIAVALYHLGGVLADEGANGAAEARLVECVAFAAEIGFKPLEASAGRLLGTLRASVGGGESGVAALTAARDLAAGIGSHGEETLARCHLAALPGGDVQDGLLAFEEHDEGLDPEERIESRFLLWKATDDAAHLGEAKRLTDELVAGLDDDTRAAVLTNRRLPRQVMTAWKEHCA